MSSQDLSCAYSPCQTISDSSCVKQDSIRDFQTLFVQKRV